MAKKAVDTSAALERILSAYGFKQQKELAEHLGIHGNNVSSWLARDSIPSNVFLECALDTGTDVNWLVYGKLANASIANPPEHPKGKELHDEILSNGGRQVLDRILEAYGFTTQKQLCDLLGISSGTVSTWVRRDYFPGDIVIACSIDTGVSLEWLAIGRYSELLFSNTNTAIILEKYSIESGSLIPTGTWSIDEKLIKPDSTACKIIEKKEHFWLVNFDEIKINNGYWLISIDGVYDIYQVIKIPNNRIRLIANQYDFDCMEDDIKCIARVLYDFHKM